MDDRKVSLSSMPSRKKTVSEEQLSALKILHSKGKGNRDIARVLDIHHKTVANYLKAEGLKANFGSAPIDKISDFEARCSKCKEIKPIDEFQKGRKGTSHEYTFSYCNACRKKQTYLNLNKDVRRFLADRHNRLKRRCEKENVVCTITKEQFILQYYHQKGLCFYTDAEMICEVGSLLHRDSLSIDKLIPKKGYCPGNVVFTTHRINTCKCDLSLEEIQKWMPEWYRRIENFIGALNEN